MNQPNDSSEPSFSGIATRVSLMKILQLGNVCNVAFNYAKYLRKSGFECDLAVSKNPNYYELPPDLDYPWIKYWEPDQVDSLFKLRKLVRDYDLVHVHGALPIRIIYSLFLDKPVVQHCMGTDLRYAAKSNAPIGLFMRLAFKRCSKFFFHSPDLTPQVEKLNLNAVYLNTIVDTDVFSQPAGFSRSTGPLTFFHPTRLHWEQKRNDLVFKSFAKFLKFCPDARLIAVYFDVDKEKSKELVAELGIEKNVTFMNHLEQKDVIDLYHSCDAVIDQFSWGYGGIITLEAMSCGKPIVSFIKEDMYVPFYKTLPPVVNAQTEEDILNSLLLLRDKKKRTEFGRAGLNFVFEYHHWKKVIPQLVKQYDQILSSPGTSNTKN